MTKFKRGAPLCACGCGERVTKNKKHKRWNKLIYRHRLKKETIIPNYNEAPLCKCGCNKKVTWNIQKKKWVNFIHGHSTKTKKYSMEHKIKLCGCGCGKITKLSCCGLKWNNFIHGHNQNGFSHSNKTINKMKKAQKGRIVDDKTKAKISKTLMGRFIGDKNPMYGRCGPESHCWKGGKSFEPYCHIWIDKEYKQDLKDRDNNQCQNPDCWNNTKRLCLHHINYTKKDCHPKNLITICISCNTRANKNRNNWQDFYQNIMLEKYGYKYD